MTILSSKDTMAIIDKIELGKRLIELREILGISARHLASIIGADPSYYARAENGSGLSDEYLQILLNKFKFNRDWLLFGDGEMGQISPQYDAISLKPAKKKGFLRFLQSVYHLFDDTLHPDGKRERIKNVITELQKVYDLPEIYKKLEVKGIDGANAMYGVDNPDVFIKALKDKFSVSTSYIENNEGPMFIESDKPPIPSPLEETSIFGTFPIYEYYEAGALDDKVKTHSNIRQLKIADLFNGSQYILRIAGNSMSPDFPSGTIIGIRKIEDKLIVPGHVYVIEKDNDLWVKRLFYKDDNQSLGIFQLLSDNTVKHESGSRHGKPLYPDFEVPIDKIKRLFKITGIFKPVDNTII